MISKISSKILQALVHCEDEYITTSQLAKKIQISQRTIHNYMNEVEEFCEEKGGRLVRKKGKGFSLDMGEGENFFQTTFSKEIISEESSKYRINYIIRTLINSVDPYTAGTFADELYVSKSTIRRDITQANKELKSFDIRIIQKPGSGIIISGDEFRLRQLLVSENQRDTNIGEAQEIEISDYRIENSEYQRMRKQYRQSTVEKVIHCVQELERETGSQWNDYTFTMIVEYVSNQINRMKKNCFLQKSMINSLTLVEEVANWADILTRFLNKEFNLNIDPRESLYLYILLLGAELQNSTRIINKKILLEKEISIEKEAKYVINYISSIVRNNYGDDSLLHTSVMLFLNSSLVRVKFGFQIANPFMQEVKKNYSAIFSACFTVGKEYEKLVGNFPSEDEISYMTLLFAGGIVQQKREINTAFIGSEGIGISQIVARKIEKELQDINIISVYPARETLNIKEEDYDLVITTVPSLKIKHPFVVYTTPMVEHKDIYRIRKICQDISDTKKSKQPMQTMENLIRKDLILFERKNITKEEVLKKACDLLLEKGYVEEGFYQDVLRREKISASVLGDGVALPHGIADYVKKPAVVIIRSDHNIEWTEGNVDIIFLLALKFDDIQSTRAFFSTFYEMTMEKDFAQMIRNAKNKDEIIKLVAMNTKKGVM